MATFGKAATGGFITGNIISIPYRRYTGIYGEAKTSTLIPVISSLVGIFGGIMGGVVCKLADYDDPFLCGAVGGMLALPFAIKLNNDYDYEQDNISANQPPMNIPIQLPPPQKDIKI